MWNVSDGIIKFANNNAERMSIGSGSGNVFIRTGNLQFGASGSETGQIEISSTRLLLRSTGDASGLRFDGSAYTPFKNGSGADGTVDLGFSAGRYKDLYLSGGLLVGGTGSANKLDDYEEGTYTPAITIDGSSSGITYNSGTAGHYTKIGRLCVCNIRVNLSSKGSSSGGVRVTLPFTNQNVSTQTGTATLDYVYNFSSLTNDNVALYADQNSSTAVIFQRTTGGSINQSNINNDSQFGVTFTFFTT